MNPPLPRSSDDLPPGQPQEPHGDARERLEHASATRGSEPYELRLYVAGMTPRSSAAISAIKSICETHLTGHYDLEVVDLAAAPALARQEQIVAAPTLVKRLPLPLRRLVGDLSSTERVLHALDLQPEATV
jgi:circadian clock protein KaiB